MKSGRRWAAVVVVGGLLVAVAGSAVALRGGSTEHDLRPAHPTTTYVGIRMTDTTHEFHIVTGFVEAPGQEVTLLKVDALTSPNIDFLGAVALSPRNLAGTSPGVGPRFPPPDLAGYYPPQQPIPPGETAFRPTSENEPPAVAVVAGFRLRSGDVGAVNGIRVTYQVGDKKITEVKHHAAVVCIPDCKDESSSDGFSERVLRQFGLLPGRN